MSEAKYQLNERLYMLPGGGISFTIGCTLASKGKKEDIPVGSKPYLPICFGRPATRTVFLVSPKGLEFTWLASATL